MGLITLNLPDPPAPAVTRDQVAARCAEHKLAKPVAAAVMAIAAGAERDNVRLSSQALDNIIAQTQQAISPLLFTNLSGDGEDPTFRRITSPNTLRDLNPVMHLRMQAVCYYLRVTTPFGKRIVEVITQYVVGEGFKASSKSDQVEQVLKKFWQDPVNNLDQKLGDWCDELTTFGELCVPVAVNPVDGSVRLGYIDPQKIESVEYGLMQTSADGDQDLAYPIAVILRREVGQQEPRRLRIIHTDEDPNSPTYGQLAGDCFYFSINKASGASRGISELFSLADWIDVFDQMMFDFADKVRFLNSFLWDYTLKGADEKQVDAFRKKVTQSPPRQGSVHVHNESVEIQAQTPDLKGADMSEAARLVKLYGLGGAGLPAWFFADPIDANRSTADEMTGPTGKKLTARQNHLRYCVLQVLSFVIAKARQHGVLPELAGDQDEPIIETPDLMIKDLQKAAITLGNLTNAAAMAEENGWITGETAARIFHIVVSQIGVQIDSKTEFQAAQAEREQRRNAGQNALDPQQYLATALKALGQSQPGGKTPAGDAGAVNPQGNA